MKRFSVFAGALLCLPLLAGDLTAGNGNYFHVDDFAGLTDYFAPLEGSQSLWCGRRSAPGMCGNGYGHDWDECWESCEFSVSGDMTIEYDILYAIEPSYDFAYVEYRDVSDNWVQLAEYSGNGFSGYSESFVVPSASLGATVRFRFRFDSDSAWDNEDCLSYWTTGGACIIDNLAVKQGATVLNFQDFEVEPSGAQQTQDGVWVAGMHPGCNPIRVEPSTWGRVKSLYR
jgi:hypothetical protein